MDTILVVNEDEQLNIEQIDANAFRVSKSEITQQDINALREKFDMTDFKIYRSGYNVTMQFKTW